nr:MAG TPA: hypothetical protein [Caudoviricetes sp.]
MMIVSFSGLQYQYPPQDGNFALLPDLIAFNASSNFMFHILSFLKLLHFYEYCCNISIRYLNREE